MTLVCNISACSKNDNVEVLNEDYYSALGYHSITIDEYATISSDKNNLVVISKTKYMAKHNSTINVLFNIETNSDFIQNNGNVINFKEGQLLSGFQINANFYNTENASIIVKENLEIKSVLSNFNAVGIAINSICNRTPTKLDLSNKIENIENTLEDCLYFYANSPAIEDFSEDNLITNTTIKSSIENLQNNMFNLIISAEIFNDTTEVYIYIILRDENNDIYLYETEFKTNYLNEEIVINHFSNENSMLNAIKLTLSHDITVKDEYL